MKLYLFCMALHNCLKHTGTVVVVIVW